LWIVTLHAGVIDSPGDARIFLLHAYRS